MKNKFLILVLTCASFMSGVSLASSAKEEVKRAKVVATQDKNIINIAITPDPTYKWNGQYPASLKFSVCSDLECVMYTENIIVKKAK